MTTLEEIPFTAAHEMPATPAAALPFASAFGGLASDTSIRWSWACRVLSTTSTELISREIGGAPRAGDLALLRVEELGSHDRITTKDNLRLRIYPGDLIVGAFGNRYATDAFEGLVEDTNNLCLLTAGGMIGTLKSRHSSVAKPTILRFLGYVGNGAGSVLNLKSECFIPKFSARTPKNLIAVVGTGMNAGKTTSCVKLIKALSRENQRVAACKLTGSVSNRDQDEMRAASAVKVLDFSDYGFPSTYLCDKPELMLLFDTLMAEMHSANPDITVMEIADGILQRETTMLLEDPRLRSVLAGVVLAADNALSARYALDLLQALGHRVIAVTGLLTSSPLCMREFEKLSSIPVAPSTGNGAALGAAVLSFINTAGK